MIVVVFNIKVNKRLTTILLIILPVGDKKVIDEK